jgi:hypothetical protein
MARTKTDPVEEGALSVRGIDSEGNAPKRRIATPSAAYQSYQQMLQYNCRRDVRFGDIEAINLGLPPTPMGANERNGQADLPNINTKQFQSKVSTYVSTWTAINAQGDGYMQVEADHPDPMEAERRGKILTYEANAAIRIWEMMEDDDFESGNQYVLECAARDTQMGLYGIGVAFFRDNIDFRFRVIPTRKVLVPDKTRLTLDNCPAIYIVDHMSVTDLYGMIGTPRWDKGAILRNLYDHVEMMNKSAARQYSYAEWIEQIRENDSWLLNDFLPVRIIYGFVKEFDGSITQFAFTDLFNTRGAKKSQTQNKGNKEYEDAGEKFLYDRPKAAKRWAQVIVPFADNSGPECTWHGVKGFGDLIFDGCHLNNLEFNAAAKAGIMRNLMMFQAETEADAQKLDQVTFCPFGMLAPGLRLEEQKFEGDIDGALAIFGMGSQVMAENTRISPPNEKTVTNEQPTATQVTADRADRAQLTTLQIAIYRAVGQDPLFGQMYRRLAQPAENYPTSWGGGRVAKRFRERCAERGIPEEDLLKIKCVKANRNVGSGDLALDIMKADQLISVATPGKGQLNARKEKVAALKGVEMVSAFIEDEPEPTPEDQVISTENNLIQVGQIPTAFGWNDQQKHVVAHMQLLAEASNAATALQEQGIQPNELEGAKKLNNLIAAGIGHVGQHVALMSEIPRIGKSPAFYEQAVKDLTKQLHNLQQINDALAEDIAKADQAQQPQMTPEMMKAQMDMQIEVALAQHDMQLKEQAQQAKLGNLAVQTQARTEAKMQDHELSVAMKAQEAEQKAAEATAKTVQDLAQQQAENTLALEQKKKEGELKIAQEKQKAAAKPKTSKPKKK